MHPGRRVSSSKGYHVYLCQGVFVCRRWSVREASRRSGSLGWRVRYIRPYDSQSYRSGRFRNVLRSVEQREGYAEVVVKYLSLTERRADMYVSTLQSMIKAMGGTLQIAVFPEGKVEIDQFRKLKRTDEAD